MLPNNFDSKSGFHGADFISQSIEMPGEHDGLSSTDATEESIGSVIPLNDARHSLYRFYRNRKRR